MPRLIEFKDMTPRAKAVVEEIAKRRNGDPADINNVWKALARHPAVMERFAEEMKVAFAPGKLDPLTKELIYVAVSVVNGCSYCVHSHTAAARAKGMTPEMHGELLSVIAMASQTNALATALGVEADKAFKAKAG